MNIDGMKNHLRVAHRIHGDLYEGTVADILRCVKHDMVAKMAVELEARLRLSCRYLENPCDAYEFSADLWVFNREQLRSFIHGVQEDARRAS